MSIKKLCCLPFAALIILSLSGCTDNTHKDVIVIPTSAVSSGEMPIDTFLSVLNSVLSTESEDSVMLSKDSAESFTVPVPDGEEEVLFIFFIGDLEIGLFTDDENNCLISAYVRSLLYGDDYTELQMMSFAGAVLSVLEPDEFENMLADVLPESSADTEVENRAYGDKWAVVYRRSIMNIVSANDAG